MSNSEWEIAIDNNETPQQSDWVLDTFSPDKETYFESLKSAPGRISEDVGQGVMRGLNAIPGYYEAAKTEIPGAYNAFLQHPRHALSQAGAGVAELGQNVFNTPHDLINYLSNRLNLVPQNINEKVQMGRMPNSQEEINQTFGTPQYPGEKLIRGIPRNALNIAGAKGVVSTLNPLNLTAKNITKDILRTGEKNKKLYSGFYKNLWEEAGKKGYQDLSHVVPSIDINTLRKYSPKKSIVGVEDFIIKPTLENSHIAKSDLLRLQRDLSKNTTMRTAERKQFKAVNDAIDNIQNNMFKNQKGIVDQKMLNKYNKIQKGFAQDVLPYRNNQINKYKRNEISEKELVNSLSKGEFKAKKGSEHPAIGLRKLLSPSWGKLIGSGLAGFTGYELGKNAFSPNE